MVVEVTEEKVYKSFHNFVAGRNRNRFNKVFRPEMG
jgi:hypothetical protein